MLHARTLRELRVDGGPGVAGMAHLSAASGLVVRGTRLFVVADDENHLAVFDLADPAPGRLVPIFDGVLPQRGKARKAAKPDCEVLLELPAFGPYPYGALMAMGSGSRPSRQRGALLPFDAAGDMQGPVHELDLAPLLAPLHEHFLDLNIEGAFFHGDTLSLLQRGNSASAINARIDWNWPALQAWLASAGPVPRPALITRFELGAIDGVPLAFTDGAALPGGHWLFSAAAEDTTDTYNDGACLGSVIGIADAGGTIRSMERLSPNCKVEGIAAQIADDRIALLMVTDADDRSRPALLLSTSLSLAGYGTDRGVMALDAAHPLTAAACGTAASPAPAAE